jgi:hypothetical protein
LHEIIVVRHGERRSLLEIILRLAVGEEDCGVVDMNMKVECCSEHDEVEATSIATYLRGLGAVA